MDGVPLPMSDSDIEVAINEYILVNGDLGRYELLPRIREVVQSWDGREHDALTVLQYAAQKGHLEKYIDALDRHAIEQIMFVAPETRCEGSAGARRTDMFVAQCYRELGVELKPLEPREVL